MNEKLPTREQAIQLLRENGCSVQVVRHCMAVAKLALETAHVLNKNGYKVDLELVESGALLHDIGRSRTHSVHHALVGAEMARGAGLPTPIISIIKRHVGGGIDKAEAAKLGWPKSEVHIPMTLEEKIVSNADKRVEGSKRVPIGRAIEQLERDQKPEAAKRVAEIHQEIALLVGDRHD